MSQGVGGGGRLFFLGKQNDSGKWTRTEDVSGQIIVTSHGRKPPKWWFSKGIPLISGKSRLVKYYNLARCMNPIENGDFPASHVSLLEGITHNHQEFQVP